MTVVGLNTTLLLLLLTRPKIARGGCVLAGALGHARTLCRLEGLHVICDRYDQAFQVTQLFLGGGDGSRDSRFLS